MIDPIRTRPETGTRDPTAPAPWPCAARRQGRRRLRQHWMLGLGIIASLWLFGGCAEEEEELEGSLGSGTGGPPVNQATVESHNFDTAQGSIIGIYQFDSSHLLHYHPDPEDPGLHVLSTVPEAALQADLADGSVDQLGEEDMVVFVTRIVGRPDTPCRFQAALLDRDSGYSIGDSGEQVNEQGLVLHQVHLVNGAIPNAQRFYCAEISGNLGIQMNVVTRNEPVQIYQQVYFILNSIDISEP